MFNNNMNKLDNSYYRMLGHNPNILQEKALEKILIEVQDSILYKIKKILRIQKPRHNIFNKIIFINKINRINNKINNITALIIINKIIKMLLSEILKTFNNNKKLNILHFSCKIKRKKIKYRMRN